MPGNNHWQIFLRCLEQISAKGNDVPDAYHAAIGAGVGLLLSDCRQGVPSF